MATRNLALLVRVAALAIIAWGFQRLRYTDLHPVVKNQTGGWLQYFTVQGALAAFLALGMSVCADMAPASSGLVQLKRQLSMVAIAAGVIISTVVYTPLTRPVERELDPNEVDPSGGVSTAHDLALHAVPALALLLNFYLFEPKFKATEINRGKLAAAMFLLGYGTWVEFCSSRNGGFPYTFQKHPLPVRISVYSGLAAMGVLSLTGVNALHP